MATNELKIVGLTHQAILKDAVIAYAMINVNNTSIQATLRNITNNATNVTVKNNRAGAAEPCTLCFFI